MCSGEMGLTQVEQGFSLFFDKFLPCLMIFQSETTRSHCMQNFEKSSNMAINEVKPCSTCLKPISLANSEYPKMHFWRHYLSLIVWLVISIYHQVNLKCATQNFEKCKATLIILFKHKEKINDF